MTIIANTLFPTHTKRPCEPVPSGLDPPLFTMDELTKVIASLRNRKAPRPDGLPVKVLKAAAKCHIDLLLTATLKRSLLIQEGLVYHQCSPGGSKRSNVDGTGQPLFSTYMPAGYIRCEKRLLLCQLGHGTGDI